MILQTIPALQDRKIILVMPLVLFPFLTLLFWAAGGGKNDASPDKPAVIAGLNTQLPDARLPDKEGTDKLSFYLRANRDSVKKAEEKGRDPFWNSTGFDSSDSVNEENAGYRKPGGDYDPLPPSGAEWKGLDNNEAKVYQKMSRLNRILAGAQQTPQSQEATNNSRFVTPPLASGDRKQEVLLQAINQAGADPELEQLNTMLDKIAAIQHPETERGSGNTDNENADRNSLRVRKTQSTAVPTLSFQVEKDRKTATNKTRSAFYSESYLPADTVTNEGLNTFSALVPRTQTIINGSTIQLQLQQDVEVGGTLIGKGNYLTGVASASGERLLIKIKFIRVDNNVYPVSLEVYDMDGLPGIYTPGSSTGDVVRQSAGRLANGFGFGSLDPSIGAQAAAAGIETAKSLMSKKAKLIRITVPAGYRILLKDSETN